MKKNNTKNAQKTIEAMRAELEAKTRRLKAFEIVLSKVDAEISWRMVEEVEQESYRDENGEWHGTVYKRDEDGEIIKHAPTEDDWTYEEYTALCSVRDEILALL